MFKIRLLFYGELADFFAEEIVAEGYECETEVTRRSLKDLIESLGVPHPEIQKVVLDGREVPLSHVICGPGLTQVFPKQGLALCGIDRNTVTDVLKALGFVCDVHLGRLARMLRLLGFDARYDNRTGDEELADISRREKRLLLTRDCRLLMRSRVQTGLFIRNSSVDEQVGQVLNRLDLREYAAPFSRCLTCNGYLSGNVPIRDLGPDQRANIPEGVMRRCRIYSHCLKCGAVYWEGSHYSQLKKKIQKYLEA